MTLQSNFRKIINETIIKHSIVEPIPKCVLPFYCLSKVVWLTDFVIVQKMWIQKVIKRVYMYMVKQGQN